MSQRPKFTPSRDGVERANIRVELRLTAEEIAEFKTIANDEDQTLRSWLRDCIWEGIHRARDGRREDQQIAD